MFKNLIKNKTDILVAAAVGAVFMVLSWFEYLDNEITTARVMGMYIKEEPKANFAIGLYSGFDKNGVTSHLEIKPENRYAISLEGKSHYGSFYHSTHDGLIFLQSRKKFFSGTVTDQGFQMKGGGFYIRQ